MRRFGLAVATALVAGFLGVTWSGVAVAATSYTVSASAKPATALVGTSIAVTGSVRPAAPGKKVWLQRYYSGAWHSVKSSTLSSTSTYRFSVTAPASPKVWSFRVVKPAGVHGRGVSSTRRVRVVGTKFSVAASVTPATRLPGEPFEVAGSVSPAAAGTAVSLQLYSDYRWSTIATTTLSSRSRFTFRRAFGLRRPSYFLRVVKPYSTSVAAGVSETVGATVVGTQRVSVSRDDAQTDLPSSDPSMSADGRYVAFTSHASNLVAGDSNNAPDVFVKDRSTGSVTRVSEAGDGTQANDDSGSASISADGRYIAFTSAASNLVPGDTNNTEDVFVQDRKTRTLSRVSVASAEQQANRSSTTPSISADGRYVAFTSLASNLVGDDTNHADDVFVKDRILGTLSRVSVGSGQEEGDRLSWYPSISADGRYVAFQSLATNLVLGDSNDRDDVFVKDLASGTLSRVSVSGGGAQANDSSWYPRISGDGRYVAFQSVATNLVTDDVNAAWHVYVKDRMTGLVSLVSQSSDGSLGNGDNRNPAISADGRHVVFTSEASDLVPGDTNQAVDVFVKDLTTGALSRVSISGDGEQGDLDSSSPAISADGRYAAYTSEASNLAPSDTNGSLDVFIRQR